MRRPSRNPYVGAPQPTLFGEEQQVFVPAGELDEERLEKTPREYFTQEEFDSLDEEIQERIRENDPASRGRVERMVEEFEKRHKWATEPDEQHIRDSFEDDFDTMMREYADELVDRARRYDRSEIDSIFDTFRGEGYTDDQIEAAFLEALQDNNNYERTYFTDEYGNAFFKAQANESFYIDRDDLDEILEGMFPDEIEAALKEINRVTDLSLDADDLRKRHGIEINDYAQHWADMDPVWERVHEDVKDHLRGEEPEAVPEVPELPAEERIVHRWPDGFYVLDLLPQELPKEGKNMGMCVGRPDMGYARAVAQGQTKILSLRRPSGKPLFTIEVSVQKGRISAVHQIKGKANRLPGWDLGKESRGAFKEDEVRRTLELLEKIGIDPTDARDLRPALEHMKALPPKKENPRPRRNPCPSCGAIRHNPGKTFCDPVG